MMTYLSSSVFSRLVSDFPFMHGRVTGSLPTSIVEQGWHLNTLYVGMAPTCNIRNT